MGQATRQLLAGDMTLIPIWPCSTRCWEKRRDSMSPLVPQIRASFRPDALPEPATAGQMTKRSPRRPLCLCANAAMAARGAHCRARARTG
ncbi:hypothetical protein H2136_19450 [Aeromonas hydrophila]|uniref:Uncharacterized protein n=1 Tax=Aeromonas hydrophila TaxID=644 RepID=A0A926FKJ3_AERHY|nr:hypothetical protein [Aeromonas hydrophila]